MRRAFDDALMSAAAVVILLLVLIALDERIRGQVWRRASTPPSMDLASATQQVSHLARVVVQTATQQSLEHTLLMVFALAATILVLFMLRT